MTSGCKRLHTLSIVVNAQPGSEEILHSQYVSSTSLLRFNVGHSRLNDPLQAAILLSHIAPNLDNLKWLQERTRSGSLDSNTGGWQKVCDLLPHLQNLRLSEKRMAAAAVIIPPVMKDASVDATVSTSESGVQAVVETSECEIQWSPILVDREIEAIVETEEMSVDATPQMSDAEIDAVPEEIIEAPPVKNEVAPSPPAGGMVGVLVTASRYVEAALSKAEGGAPPSESDGFPVPTVRGVVFFPFRVVRAYTYYATYPIRLLLSKSEKTPELPVEDEKFLVPTSLDAETQATASAEGTHNQVTQTNSGEGMDFSSLVAHV